MERLSLDHWSSPWLRSQHVERYRWATQFAAGRRVLDAACGTAYGSRLLRDDGARSVTSIDLAPEAFVGLGRSGKTAALDLARGDVTHLPLQDNACDVYVCFETIEHVEDDDALLREASRVLSPAGVFLCSTPNRNLLSPGNTLGDRPENRFHVREYSIAEFETLLLSVFPSVKLYGQTWFSERHRKRLARAGRRSNRFAVRLHQLRNILGLPLERPGRHLPRALPGDGVPEVIIGLCTV